MLAIRQEIQNELGRSHNYTEEPMIVELDNEKIKQDYLSGMSTYALAEKYGCRRKTIRKRLQKMGIETRTGRPRLALDDEQIREDYLSSKDLTRTAEKHNCSPSTIKDRLQAMGILTDTRPGDGAAMSVIRKGRCLRSHTPDDMPTRYKAFLADLFGEEIEDIEYDDTLPDTLEAVLNTLGAIYDGKDVAALRLRYGLSGQPPMTQKEVGDALGVSRERARMWIKTVQRKLRHPIRAKRFREYLKYMKLRKISEL
jgi:DNA-binding CsgD family transcriptional regulator